MRLIIDGYNLIHAAGILGHGVGPGGLERARKALLNYLVESLDPKLVSQTIVVFDAADAPPLVASKYQHRGLHVRFARGDGDADRVIEELVLAESAPRRLTVVSSDHRLHRAARRRRAQAVDSDRWFAQLLRDRQNPRSPTKSAKPSGPPSKAEVKYWLEQFTGKSIDEPEQTESSTEQSKPTAEQNDVTAEQKNPTEKQEIELPEVDPIFPPEYLDDVKKMLGEE